MIITTIGLVLIPIGLGLLFFKRNVLLMLSIIFVPFSATSVMEIKGSNSSQPVLVSVYFGWLWLIGFVATYLHRKMQDKSNSLIFQEVCLIFFTGFCFLSMLIPIFAGDYITVFNRDQMQNVSIKFDLNRIIHLGNLIYGVCFAIAFGRHSTMCFSTLKSFQWYLGSLCFVVFLGLIEVFGKYLNISYPYWFFNNTASHLDLVTGLASRVFFAVDLVRMSSVADEPSILAQNLLIGIFLIFGFIVTGERLFGRWIDFLITFTLMAGLILTWSSSAIISFVFIIGLSLLFLRGGVLGKPQGYFGFLFLVGTISVGLVFYYDSEVFYQLITGKIDSESGIERMDSVQNSINDLIQSPIFGLGWGSVTSFDLVFFLLANSGLFGCCAFFLFVWSVIVVLLKFIKLNRGLSRAVCLGVLFAFGSCWIGAAFAGWSLQFPHTFMVIGMAFGAIAQSRTQQLVGLNRKRLESETIIST